MSSRTGPDPMTHASPTRPAAADPPALRRMPEEAMALRNPWPSLRDDIAGLTEDLERDFRFGHSVVKLNGNYLLGGSIKGGSSTIWAPAGRVQAVAYEAWRRREGIPQSDDDSAFQVLCRTLTAHDIALYNLSSSQDAEGDRSLGRYVAGRGYIYSIAALLLEQIPDRHLSAPQFSGLQLGRWGPDAAKASAYEDGVVFMYDFAMQGARRTFVGLLMHEIGHAHEAMIPPETMKTLAECHRAIGDAYAFLGLEFLLDAESRRVYQRFLLSEFLAETYVLYTCCGAALRGFVAAQNGDVLRAWETVYAIYRDSFGVEYE
jgi:hypothetical protein